jgi:inosine-uridine nucleoside N-ribohydrolase
MRRRGIWWLVAFIVLGFAPGLAQGQRKVIIDQDALGPAGTDINSILIFLQSPEVETLGITVVSGDGWRDEEVAHALRLLEIIGRTDIPVVPGAVFPLVNSPEHMEGWQKQYGKIRYMGAWHAEYPGWKYHDPFAVPDLEEGNPKINPANEDAAHFLVRMVRQYPHQVTLYAAGPLTNLALALAIDPQFPQLAKELIVMGGSMNPSTDDPEFTHNPQREFNFWCDPEATHAVLHAHWPKIVCTMVDISVKARVRKEMFDEIGKSKLPVAQYVSKYTHTYDYSFMWDELAAAAWIDPGIITKEEMIYLDCDVDHGAGYGNTLSWTPGYNPGRGEQLVHVQKDLNTKRLYELFVRLMSSPTPGAHK